MEIGAWYLVRVPQRLLLVPWLGAAEASGTRASGRTGLGPVSIHLHEHGGQVPNTGPPWPERPKKGRVWPLTVAFRLHRSPWGSAEETPDWEHTRGGAPQGRGSFCEKQPPGTAEPGPRGHPPTAGTGGCSGRGKSPAIALWNAVAVKGNTRITAA